MFKKFVVIFLSVSIVLLAVPMIASAESVSSDSNINLNLWSVSDFKDFFGIENSEDIKKIGKYNYFVNEEWKTDSMVINDSIMISGDEIVDGMPKAIHLLVTDGSFKLSVEKISDTSDFLRLSVSDDATYVKRCVLWNHGEIIGMVNDYNCNGLFCVYDDFSNLDFSGTVCDYSLYTCSNVYQTFMNFLNMADYDFNDVTIKSGYNNLIKFYDCFDSPKGKYNVDYYVDPMENYINSGVMFKDDVYAVSNKPHEEHGTYQVDELLDFYVMINPNKQNTFSEFYDNPTSINALSAISDYLSNNSTAIHYENGDMSTYEWFNDVIASSRWITGGAKFELGYFDNVYYRDSSDFGFGVTSEIAASIFNKFSDYPDLEHIAYIKFTMPNTYSYLERSDGGSSILQGCHTRHSCKYINPETGAIRDTGFGSNISNADHAEHPDKNELLNDGWQRGYPNSSGNYPYKMTLNVNGEPYLYVYFDSMPSVTSNYFSDSCIQYGVNFYGKKGYFYDPYNNVSKNFDMTNFSTEMTDDFNTQNYFEINGNKYRDPVDAIKDFLGSTAQSVTSSLLGIDISEFSNTFTAYFWTNYTGSLNSGYNGYYVQFNWQLEGNEHFQKNNSDDNHNYDDDYLPDDGFTDNNGNTHGGAVEPPTDTSDGSGLFGDSDFSFDDNTLWSYANQFLSFCAKSFSVLPSWVWALIGSGIAIIIFLRILGR